MLQMGSRGADVKTLQQDLSITGFNTRVTGVFNGTTRHSVVRFQRSHHLSADGVVGPQTAGAIRSAVRRAHASADQGAAAAAPSTTTTSTTTTPTTTTSTTTTPGTTTTGTTTSGGSGVTAPPPNSPPEQATLDSNGLAVAPPDAPAVVREVIAAANKIAYNPYTYGGGHQSFNSNGYDCSGSVSYALHGGGLLSSPEDSTQLETYGSAGQGTWITIWADSGHAYMEVAGLFFDTAAMDSRNGDRWSQTRVSGTSGFTVRHPTNW